ncbi:MAG: Rieske 2Fe-2S domain-containing protein [Chloroflexi bacterium]|nr:Rieske 2Fe-2S domain-containing protein [Chloroflexota bacterium]
MLTAEDNELVTHVGPGTPGGHFFRQYWLPFGVSTELPAPDCDPVRIMLLGEKLIAFRDSNGKVGLIQNHCPHRGASLFFGRNEEAGLRCVYHGWKFDVSGQCVDMPNEPAESNFKTKVKATAYPVEERGGLLWAYLGPRATPPGMPDIEPNMRDDMHRNINVLQTPCNWLQALEGDIDTVHASFLHGGSVQADERQSGTFSQFVVKDRGVRFEAMDTPIGACAGAWRPGAEGHKYWRIAQFMLPCFDMAAPGLLGYNIKAWLRTPMDDHHTLSFFIHCTRDKPGVITYDRGPGNRVHPNSTDWFGRFRMVAGPENDWEINRDLQRANKGGAGYSGIDGSAMKQDAAVTWSMGPIYDRTNERLGSTDLLIIRTRQRILGAMKALRDDGVMPPGVDDPALYRVRAGGVMLPWEADWVKGTEELRRAFVEHPELDPAVTGGA